MTEGAHAAEYVVCPDNTAGHYPVYRIGPLRWECSTCRAVLHLGRWLPAERQSDGLDGAGTLEQ